jgi:hypothetical protein
LSTVSAAVVVPVYSSQLGESEQISLRSLERHLGRHKIVIAAPEGLPLPVQGFAEVRFPPRFFAARHTYSKLLVSREFYAAFTAYTHILVYQLDCLVFSDRLHWWCEQEYDYVGAPWVEYAPDGSLTLSRVGNGGLSLRRVAACLEVIEARDRAARGKHGVQLACRFARRLSGSMFRGLRALGSGEGRRFLRRSARAVYLAARDADPRHINEDLFWADARSIVPTFRIPPAEVALRFAFEMEPQFCFTENGGILPFGCHQWQVYDPDFWSPFVSLATGGD